MSSLLYLQGSRHLGARLKGMPQCGQERETAEGGGEDREQQGQNGATWPEPEVGGMATRLGHAGTSGLRLELGHDHSQA